MLNKKLIIILLGCIISFSLACNLGNTEKTAVPGSTPVDIAPVEPEIPTKEPSRVPTVVESTPQQSNKGQVAYVKNGNVFIRNLETNMDRQLTFDADAQADFLHVYHSITFSDSGRYLAYEFGHPSDGTIASYVVELSNFTQTAYLKGEKLMGWLWNEDVLWIGHNTQECQDGMTAADNGKISFEVFEFSADSGNKSLLTTISGGYMLPMSVGTRQNWMYFQSCPCDYYECEWHYPTYSLQSGIPTELEIKGAYQISPNGGKQIPIDYSIHQPETAGLQITDQNGVNPVEIYREDGKFIMNAQWAPLDDWIIFLISDTINRDWFELRMIRPDGGDLRTISYSRANVVNWMPGGETMIFLDAKGDLQTYHLETGTTEMLTNLKGAKQVNWSLLP